MHVSRSSTKFMYVIHATAFSLICRFWKTRIEFLRSNSDVNALNNRIDLDTITAINRSISIIRLHHHHEITYEHFFSLLYNQIKQSNTHTNMNNWNYCKINWRWSPIMNIYKRNLNVFPIGKCRMTFSLKRIRLALFYENNNIINIFV